MSAATFIIIDDANAGQRIDNFLLTKLKGVPNSRIYKALRKGEVRVNKGRIQATYRLKKNDSVRLPPLRVAEKSVPTPSKNLRDCLSKSVIFEDDHLIVVNKPVGLAVHGGSDVACGLIEAFRFIRPDVKFLELVHRLDRDTSGCLMIAKNRATLVALQALQKSHEIKKQYVLLVKGKWNLGKQHVKLALTKNKLAHGERVVVSDADGKPSETIFEPLKFFKDTTLLRATLITGRTHQIRVHAADLGFPIVGDGKYGDWEFNRFYVEKYDSKRLFLHAEKLSFALKIPYSFEAPMPIEFMQ